MARQVGRQAVETYAEWPISSQVCRVHRWKWSPVRDSIWASVGQATNWTP